MKEEQRWSSPQPKIRKIHNHQVSPKELWRELNLFRRNPNQFYTLISSRKNNYNKQGLLFSNFHPYRSIKTIQGRQPINELLEQLVNQQALNPIAYNTQLNKIADALALQFKSCHSTNTEFELNPRQLRQMLDRSQKYIFPHPVNCVIGVGFRDEYEPLISLLIDDGQLTRQNRRALLSREYEVCGIGAVPLADGSLLCAVYLFTRSIIPKSIISQAF